MVTLQDSSTENPSSVLEPGQIKWLERALGDLPKMKKTTDILARKLELLDGARKAIESRVGEIAVGQDFEVNLKKGGLEGFLRSAISRPATIRSIGETGSPDDELDTEHDKTEGLDPKSYQKLMKAQSIIEAEVFKLRQAKDDDGEPIPFSDKEIADAIWAPLMRRKIIPENAIPDAYSETARTFEGASDEYETRLLAYSEKLSKWDTLVGTLGVASEVVKGIGKAAASSTKLLKLIHVPVDASGHAEAINKVLQGDQIKSIVQMTTVLLSGALDIGKQVAADHGKLNSKSVQAIAGKVATMAGQIAITSCTVAANGDESIVNIGQTVADAIAMGLSGMTFGAKVVKGDTKGAMVGLGDFIQKALGVVGDQANCPQAKLSELGAAIAAGFALAAEIDALTETVEGVIKKSEQGGKPDYTAIEVALASTAEKAVQGAMTTFLKWYEIEGASEQKNLVGKDFTSTNSSMPVLTLSDKLAKLQAMTPDELKEAYKDDPKMLELGEAIKKEQAGAVKQANEDMEAMLDEEAKSFRALLAGGETGDEEGELQTIEAVILKIKLDQTIVELVHTIIKLPAAAVAMVLPQASIALSAIDLCFKIGAAIQHYVALAEWRENLGNARSAMSVQVEAMASRVGLASLQAVDSTIQVLNQGATLMAQVTAATGDVVAVSGGHFTAGPGKIVSAVGTGIEVAVTVESALWSTGLKVATKLQLADGWKKYQTALKNPKDRKAVRKAIRSNPTLAKYVIAYGAIEEKNPVAMNVMQKCGLNAEVLNRPSANALKVVTLLETLCPEDPVLLHAIPVPRDWHPGEAELTSVSIATFFAVAEREVKLKKGQGRDLVRAVTDMEDRRATYEKLHAEWTTAGAKVGEAAKAESNSTPEEIEQLQQDAGAALKRLQASVEAVKAATDDVGRTIRGLKPVDTSNKPHEDMADYVMTLGTIANTACRTYHGEWQALTSGEM